MQSPSLKRFQIMQALGAGAQGSIFRGIDRETQKEVAIKVYHLRGATDWGAFDRFERECNLLAQLDHPGIPKFLAHFAEEQSGDYFLVMELIQGRSLQEALRDRVVFECDRVTALLFQGLSILGHIHAHVPPIIHRDIKPANLIIDPEGDLKLLDFGGAIERKQESESGGTMTVLGTPGYMAPEQSLGQAGPTSDLYSLGVSMLALLGGVEGTKMPRQGMEIDIDSLCPPSPLREILRGCIHADATQRFPSAGHAYSALQAATQSNATESRSSQHYGARHAPGTPNPFGSNPFSYPGQDQASAGNYSAHSSGSKSEANRRSQDDTNLPAPNLQHDLEQLSKVQSPPLRFILWMIATAGIGIITVLKTIMLPIIEAIMRSNPPNASKPRDHATLANEDNRPENIARRLSSSQQQLEVFAKKTSPFEDHPS